MYITKTVAGNVIEIVSQEHKNSKCTNLKIDQESYISLCSPLQIVSNEFAVDADGCAIPLQDTYEYNGVCFEKRYFKKSEKRGQQLGSLKKTLRKLRNIVNANTDTPENCLWVTLTYAENMQDKDTLYLDMKNFIKRLHYHITDKFEYINVVEPQRRGAWHCHIIFIFEQSAPFIANSILAEIWGKGFVKITNLQNNDGVGNYLTSYLADIPLEEFEGIDDYLEIVEKEVDGKKKKFVKGARLMLYPSGMNLFRCSRGIKRPTKEVISLEDKFSIKNDLALQFSQTTFIADGKGYENTITYEQYNKKRKCAETEGGIT